MSDDDPRDEDLDAAPPAPADESHPPAAEPAATGVPLPYQAAGRASWWGYLFFGGLIMLLAGVLWYLVEKDSRGTLTLQGWLFVSLVATLAPIAWHIVDIWEALRTRRAAAALFVVITLLLGGAALGIVSFINHKFESTLPALDTTTTGKYTLGEETRKLLEQLEGTVYATYLRQGGTDIGTSSSALEQLRIFQAVSSTVVVRDFDAFLERDRAEQYLAEKGVPRTSSGETQDVIVFSYASPGKMPVPGKHKELRVDPYTWQKQSALGEVKWLGERLIAEAILELVFERYKVYATGGHGERKMSQEMRMLREALGSQNIEVVDEPLELTAKPQVPEDCDVLFVLDPQTQFAPAEAAAIQAWLDEGNTLLLAVDPAEGKRECGLEDILGEHALYPRLNYRVIAPVPVAGGDREVFYRMRGSFPVLAGSYSKHPAVKAISSRAGFATYFSESTYIELDDEPPEGVEAEPVVYAPDVPGLEQKPFAARLTAGRTDFASARPELGDKVGARLTIVATSTRRLPSGPGEPRHDSRIIYFSDTDVLTDRVASQARPNVDLAIGLVQWGIGREGLVAISDRTIEREFVTIEPRGLLVAFWWPFGVCLLSLIAGGVVWWARRR